MWYSFKVLNTSGTHNHSAFGPTNLSLSPLHPGPLQGSLTTWVQSAHNVYTWFEGCFCVCVHLSLHAQLRSNFSLVPRRGEPGNEANPT